MPIGFPFGAVNKNTEIQVYEVETSNTSGTGASVQLKRKVFDDKFNIVNQETQNVYYQTVFNNPINFENIQLMYGGRGWELKANAPVYVSNKVYQAGELITYWGYATTVKLLIVSGGVINSLLNKIKHFLIKLGGV